MHLSATAALQQAGAQGGTSLTLDAWGILLLAAILVIATGGWWLFLAMRRPQAPPPPAPAVAPAPPPPPPPPPEDPLLTAFRTADTGLAEPVLMLREGKIVMAGTHAALRLRIDAAAVEGLRLTGLARAEDVLPLAEAIQSMEAPEAPPRETVFRLAGPPGSPYREIAARFVRPPGVPPGSCLVFLSDITAPSALAREAAGAAQRLESALTHLREGVLVTTGPAQREAVVLTNPGFREMFGVPASGVVGRTVAELRERMRPVVPEEILEGFFLESAEGTELFTLPGDPPRLIERSVRPAVEAAAGGRLFLFRDVTQERAREESLQRNAREAEGAREALEALHEQLALANEGLERRLSEFARFNRELKVLDEMKSNLLANVSHELQTPLVSIKGYTEMILKGRLGPLTEEQERGLRAALRNVDRLIGLIDSLLGFARSEKEGGALRLESFPLKALLDEVLDLMKEQAAARKIKMSAAIQGGDLWIRGDRDRIAQVFINLVSNGIKYNNDGGSVVIEAARARRNQARVEVRDTGRGIARDDLEKIFDRFYRAAEAGSSEKGTGLGLAIARDILRQHGCMIRADSEPGKGSTFSFTLPLDPRRPERSARAPAPEKDAPA